MLIANSDKFNQKQIDRLSPFNTANACVYEKNYLSGFVADGYTKGLNECWQDAKNTMDSLIRQHIKREYNADVIDYLNVSTTHENVTYKYLLLPVYFLSYKYGKKSYGVAVNGCSGKVRGKTPISPLRVAIAVILGLAALVGLAFFIMRFSNGESAETALNAAKTLLI